jgi:hypothetical protein
MKTQCLKTRTLLAGAALLALAASPLARADYQSTVLSQGPVGYWRLTETTPSPAPITIAANLGSSAAGNGTYNGPSGYFRGQPGALANSTTSARTDGAAQNITVPYNADLNPAANFTVEAWLKADAASGQCPLSCAHATSPRSGWFFYQLGATGYEFRMYNQNGNAFSVAVVGNVANVVGVWTHVVATFDGTTAKLYLNGVLAGSGTPTGTPNYVPGTDGIFAIGMRSDTGFPWAGGVDEVAFYPSLLTAGEIAAHYGAASSNAAGYPGLVTGKSPRLYLRLNEAGNTPTANLGSLGAAGNGEYTSGTTPGQVGPRPAAYPGFDAGNNSTLFSSAGGSVAVPPLRLNANTVTISGWVKPSGSQALAAGLVVCNGSGTYGGLIMDPAYGGYGLGYQWGSSPNNVSFSSDLGLPPLVDSQWSYVALVIQPSQAAIYVCDYLGNWASATNGLFLPINNSSQPFSAATLFGMDAGYSTRNFNGNLDEVAIFNRALGAGELYTQYAEAVGGVKPVIFADLQGPTEDVALGDPIVLKVDAGGTPGLIYTWRKNGADYASTTNNGILTIASTVVETSSYDVTIANGFGDVTSLPVSVRVVTPTAPTATRWEGFNNRTLYKGGTLRLAVVATGGGLKYKWYKGGSPIASATSSTLTIPVVTNSDAGSYSVYVTNSAGSLSNGPVVITIPNVGSNSYDGVIITAGPEAWWRMDEAAGSTNMFDGMGRHDGIYTNAVGGVTLPTMGVTGALITNANTAATFSSTGKGIGMAPYSPDLGPGKYSIEAWIKTSVLSGQVPVSSSYAGKGCFIYADAGWWRYAVPPLTVGGNNENVNTAGAIIPGQWSHVVILYDNTVQSSGTFYPYRLYVNGATDGYIWGDGGVGPNLGGPFIIGARGVSATVLADLFADAVIDEVAVYKRVLSAAEILLHYNTRGFEVIPPAFTSELLSQTVTTGKSISFSTTVLGTSPTLNWYKGTPMASAPIATGTNAITFNPTALTDSGSYSLVATNSAGAVTNTATLTVIAPVSYANVTNNLVLHLRFDGNSADSSGRGNNGTPSSSPAPAFVPGIIGAQASEFTTTSVTNNGTNIAFSSGSHVKLGAVPSGPPSDLQFGASTSFSVSLWVKLPSGGLPGDLPFIGTATNAANNPGWVLCPSYNKGGWQWCLGDGASTLDVNGADNSINDGGWHSFVLTVDRAGSLAKSYLDGVLMASRSISSLGSFDNNNYWPLAIGQDPTGAYPVINGASATDFAAWIPPNTASLDDVGIWRRALTPLEVAQVASAGSTAGRSFDTVAPASVTITISSSGSSMTLSWSAGTLLQSDTLGASAVWTPVVGATAPSYTFTPGATNKFYRVLVQ